MHAFLLVYSDNADAEKNLSALLVSWHVAPIDCISIDKSDEKTEISITQIRQLTKQLTLSPRQSPVCAGIIRNAHLMNAQAQNALLKTLEEPPPNARLVLLTSMPDGLLLTIQSRCQTIRIQPGIKSHISDERIKELLTLMDASCGTLFTCIETKAPARQDALDYIDTTLAAIHESFHGKLGNNDLIRMKLLAQKLISARIQIQKNVNPKLAVENAFLEARHG